MKRHWSQIAGMPVVCENQKPVSEICNLFDIVPQHLENVRYLNGNPLGSDAVKQAISACEARLGSSGRLLIRKSGTEPLIRVMAEGDDEAVVRAVVRELCAVIEKSAHA